ncbi:MAG TPA: hypothetical protein VFI03_07035 [Solirubrobacterales bacterium]|nr:hypothetical protein [Solirubrobacterales bacterium]
MPANSEIVNWEERWSKPVALLTLLAVALLVVSQVIGGAVSGDGDAEILRSTHDHASAVTLSSLLQAVGFALFAAPLYYLFRAVRVRSDRVRGQLVGLVVIAPLFLAISTGLSAAARNEAASTFVDGDAKQGITVKAAGKDCQSEREDLGAKEFGEEFGGGSGAAALKQCTDTRLADEEASNATSEASTAAAVSGFGLAGALGLAVALFYTGLWAMRTGLLSRFWGSLGMALGVAVLIGLIIFTMVWLVYFALLIAGWLPGGKPPAWAEGKAVPWPTPGEKAAEELAPSSEESSAEPAVGEERRKRKQRDAGESE